MQRERHSVHENPNVPSGEQSWSPGAPNELGLVFPTPCGVVWRKDIFMARVFRPAVRRAGLAPLRFHDLRHTYAALMVAAGAHAKLQQAHDVIRLIEADGWVLVAQRGGHRQYEHPTKPGKVTGAGKPNADVSRALPQISFVKRDCRGQEMSEYLVVIEHEGDSWGAEAPWVS